MKRLPIHDFWNSIHVLIILFSINWKFTSPSSRSDESPVVCYCLLVLPPVTFTFQLPLLQSLEWRWKRWCV